MNKTLRVALFMFLAFGPSVSAEVIVLTDGTTVNGKIVGRDNKNLKVEFDGEMASFELDKIFTVDGKPFNNKTTKVTAVSKDQMNKDLAALVDVSKESQTKLQVIQSQSKRAAVKKFVEIVGTRDIMAKNFEQLINNTHPKYRRQLKSSLNVDEIIDNLLPLYDKHFTQTELDYYIAFFSSPAGKKLQATIPIIMKESVDVNLKYLKEKMPEGIK